MKPWFRMEVSKDDASIGDIYVFDTIGGWIDDYFGWGGVTTAKTFLEALAALPDSVTTIRLHINSPGGDVFTAATIANTLRGQKASKGRTVAVVIEGLAASAASVIAMAGDTIQMADNALLMIHNPWTWAMGEVKDLEKVIGELQKIRGTIVTTYQWHSPLSREAIEALMDAETWMDAGEAIANGFATEKVEGLKAAATIDRRATKRLAVPEKFRAQVDTFLTPETPAPAAAAAEDVMAAVSAAGLSIAFATELVKAKLPTDQVTARIDAAKTAKASADSRATEIRGLCNTAKVSDLANRLVASGMSVADVRAHLTDVKAYGDNKEINGGLPVDEPASHGWKNAFARVKRVGLKTTS